MRRSLPLLLVLALASPAVAADGERLRVVVLDLGVSSDKLTKMAAGIQEQLLTELGRSDRVEVMGTSDMTTVLGLERQKELLGCSEAANSCLTEIASALGAPYVVAGHLNQAGKIVRVDLKLVRARDGKALFRDGKNIKDSSELFDAVTAIASGMLKALDKEPRATAAAATTPKPPEPGTSSTGTSTSSGTAALTPTTNTPAPTPVTPGVERAGAPSSGPRVLPWVTVGAGVVAAGVGSALLLSASSVQSKLKGGSASEVDWAQVQAANRNFVAGPVLVGVGLAAAVGGLVWGLSGPSSSGTPSPSPRVFVSPTGSGLAAWGTF